MTNAPVYRDSLHLHDLADEFEGREAHPLNVDRQGGACMRLRRRGEMPSSRSRNPMA
jgi:hypothetical protein